jgi:cell shape-determining protein MreC
MKRRHYILFACVVVLTIVVLKLPPRAATQFKLAIGSLFLPLFGLSTSTANIAEAAGNAVVPRKELLKQNAEFQRENAEMRVQLQRMAEFERENQRLREMLVFQRQTPWKIKAASVIARDPANWWRNVQIDLGKRTVSSAASAKSAKPARASSSWATRIAAWPRAFTIRKRAPRSTTE